MYSHRGAYLQALAMAAQTGLSMRVDVPVDAADVPLQRLVLPVGGDRGGRHARGAAQGRAGAHLAGAARGGRDARCARLRPCSPGWRARRARRTARCRTASTCRTGGAPPSPALLARMADARPRRDAPVRPDRDVRPGRDLRLAARVGRPRRRTSRRGSRRARASPTSWAQPLRVLGEDGQDVPADGETLGEVLLRGNNVMLGYYRDDGGDGGGHARGLVPHRRPRRAAPRRLPRAARPVQGRHRLRRRERRVDRGRAGARRAPRGARERGGRRAPTSAGARRSVAFVVAAARARRRREAELIEHVKGRIARYKAPQRVVFERPAEDRHRQDPEVRPAGAAAGLEPDLQRRRRAARRGPTSTAAAAGTTTAARRRGGPGGGGPAVPARRARRARPAAARRGRRRRRRGRGAAP